MTVNARRLLLISLLLCGTALRTTAHGGKYNPPPPSGPPPEGPHPWRGPSDTVPGGPAPAPTSPSPGPSGPGPSAGRPLTPPSGPPSGLGASGIPASSVTPAMDALGIDLTSWSRWWDYNKAPYLDLKARIHEPQPETGSDGGLTEERVRTLRPTEGFLERYRRRARIPLGSSPIRARSRSSPTCCGTPSRGASA